ncbi:MAG: transcription elongation factor GreA [Chloroflexota bacterium]
MNRPVHYLTPEGRRRIEEELEVLRTVKRPQMARQLKSAIEEGDLAENAGYSESKREQALVEGRIAELEAILADAADLEATPAGDTVTMGAHVTVVERGFEPETYQIVGAAEADPTAGRISNESPLGRALLGRRVGEHVQVNTPSGVAQFQISEIE